jgi:ABC-type uncharacterized transport system auxiliary subunit
VRIVESGWGVWKRSRPRTLAGLGLLLGLAAASCGSLPKTYYYTLQTPPPPRARDPRTNWVLGVEHFRAPEVLRDDRIVYYESPTQLNFYQNHRWASDPATMLTDAVARRLAETGAFADVIRLPSPRPVDYLLRGRVLGFEEVDYETGVKGRVALELTLVRSQDEKVRWSATRRAESVAEGKGVSAVAKAVNAASNQVLGEMLPALIEQVEHDFQQESPSSP